MRNREGLRRKRLLACMLVVILTAGSTQIAWAENKTETESPAQEIVAGNERTEVSAENAVENEILVVYDDAGTSDKKSEKIQKDAEESLTDKDIQVMDEVAASSNGHGTIVVADIPEDVDVEEAVEMAMEEEAIAYAQPNYIYETLENVEDDTEVWKPNDSFVTAGNTYYLENANVISAWNAMNYGRQEKENKTDVTVAVLDTGCRLDHEDLKENLSDMAYDVYYGKPLTLTSTANEGDVTGGSNEGHGTQVSGVIAAKVNNGTGIAGVSYNATILPVKIFDDTGKNATSATLLAGLKYCQELIENKEVENLHVINLSIGMYSNGMNETDVLVEKQISTLADVYQVLCVCAGGNGDEITREPLTDPMYPSDYDTCLSVTSLDENGDNSTWSDYNLSKDISAPGENIFSTGSKHAAFYSSMSGTSMATPVVSGICALLWAADPSLTVNEVKEAVTNTAVPVESNAWDGREGYTGSAGAIDADAALKYVIGTGDVENRISIENAKVTFSQDAYIYSGTRIQPELTVEVDGEVLTKGKDFKVGYSNNLNAGTAKVEIQGIGKYKGTLQTTFTIEKRPMSKCTYSIQAKEFVYTGTEIKPDVKIYCENKVIEQGKDYTVVYSDNIKVGTAQVFVSGTGTNFEGRGKFSFSIVKADLSDMEITLSETSYTYDGKAKKPSVTVKYGDITLESGTDYSLIYESNVEAGTAKVTIIGEGECYTGSVTETFRIVKKSTTNQTTESSLSEKTDGNKDKAVSSSSEETEGNKDRAAASVNTEKQKTNAGSTLVTGQLEPVSPEDRSSLSISPGGETSQSVRSETGNDEADVSTAATGDRTADNGRTEYWKMTAAFAILVLLIVAGVYFCVKKKKHI